MKVYNSDDQGNGKQNDAVYRANVEIYQNRYYILLCFFIKQLIIKIYIFI